MEPIKFEDIDLNEVDRDDDLLAPIMKPDKNTQKNNLNSDMEITQQIDVVDYDE